MVSHSNIKNNHSGDKVIVTSSDNNSELRPNGDDMAATTTSQTGLLVANDSSQSVIFQQSRGWSRAIAWGIMGLMVAVISWAAMARIDEAIPADGKLEPLDGAKKIQAPIGGVVKQIYVKNGDRVKAGDLLLRLESTVPQSQLAALASTKVSLDAENRFYRSQMNPGATSSVNVSNLRIQPEVLALTKSRTALVAENQLYQSEMSGRNPANLTPVQQQRLQSNVNELNTRLAVGKLEVGQVQKQISENRVRRQGLVNQLAGIGSNILSITAEMSSGRDGVIVALGQIDRQISQNQARISATQKTLKINQDILADILPAGEAGAIAAAQIKRQEQEVINRASELEQQIQEQSRLQLEKNRLAAISKSDNQRQQQRSQEQQQLLKQRQSEISQLDQEYARLQLSASQGIEKLNSNVAIDRKDLFTQVANNDKKIAEIDSQLNKSIVENEKKITEITNQITQAQQNLKYQEIRSPVAGEVFELKAYPEGVVNTNSPDALVQIIPSDEVMANVYITNRDIGFVKVGQPVDVRIDTFNFSEFGDLKGTVEWIGSDALPPDQQNPYARFPAKIKLVQQSLVVKGESKKLKAGSSVKVNIKLRDRTVISLFTDMFSKQSDGLKNLR
jgi:hemolysin D